MDVPGEMSPKGLKHFSRILEYRQDGGRGHHHGDAVGRGCAQVTSLNPQCDPMRSVL